MDDDRRDSPWDDADRRMLGADRRRDAAVAASVEHEARRKQEQARLLAADWVEDALRLALAGAADAEDVLVRLGACTVLADLVGALRHPGSGIAADLEAVLLDRLGS